MSNKDSSARRIDAARRPFGKQPLIVDTVLNQRIQTKLPFNGIEQSGERWFVLVRLPQALPFHERGSVHIEHHQHVAINGG